MSFKFTTIKACLMTNKKTIGLFDFTYLNNNFTLLFYFKNENDKAEIFFSKVGTQETLCLPMDQDYSIDTFFKIEKYREIKSFFSIPYSEKGPVFRPIDLFNDINSRMKFRLLNANTTREERSTLYRLPNPNAIYYNYMVNWDITNPDRHCSQFNKQKVQILIPDLYQTIRDKNISVYFKDEPLNEFTEKNAIRLDLSSHLSQ